MNYLNVFSYWEIIFLLHEYLVCIHKRIVTNHSATSSLNKSLNRFVAIVKRNTFQLIQIKTQKTRIKLTFFRDVEYKLEDLVKVECSKGTDIQNWSGSTNYKLIVKHGLFCQQLLFSWFGMTTSFVKKSLKEVKFSLIPSVVMKRFDFTSNTLSLFNTSSFKKWRFKIFKFYSIKLNCFLIQIKSLPFTSRNYCNYY